MGSNGDIDYAIFNHRYDRDAQVAVRAWQPGDGTRCSSSRGTSRIPCGRPVAVVITHHPSQYARATTIRRIACANHLPGLTKAPHEIAAEATKAAGERLIAEHWETYQGYLKEETERRLGEIFEFADEAIRRLVLDAYESNSTDA